MSGEDLELSRRKALAALGTAGVASVGVGFGTSAYFSDRESYEANRLVAGELDLKVDWTEHYSDWSADEGEGIDTVASEPGDGLVGFPSAAPPAEQSVFVSDPDQLLANTAIEAFPDVLSTAEAYDARQAELADDSTLCDLPADLDGGEGVLAHPFRTRGTFGEEPNPQTTAAGDPLVNVSDVKPGDFGEVTFSLHLCGNPGYVWLTGTLRDAAENGVTEPEAAADGEEETEARPASEDSASDTVELLDELRAAMWYDTGPDGVYGADFEDKDAGEGDNRLQDGEQVLPLTGSLRNVLTLLEAGMYPLDAEPVTDSTGTEPTAPAGATVVSTDDGATTYLTTEEPFATKGARNLTCADYAETLDIDDLVGTSIEADTLASKTEYPACGGSLTVDSVDIGAGSITLSSDFPVRIVSLKGGNQGEKLYVWPAPGVVLDEVVFSTPDTASGQPAGISNLGVCCTTDTVPTPEGDPGRECFQNSTTAYIGFEWWLPADTGDEVQTDGVSFDLGFYTEQCRHNDGSGMATTTSGTNG
ncbi:SipW-dependent-type signal peptide-containing protein [Haloarchaeobius amylolyticus]|uniref:SipW-dependent-type signal peptide-containing protein n=1 Tax=Haloarchaeobius amylolyticus TaxID=1198296 RepID=UPI002270B23D|nr:SipW-dependent-type signal peptide-containing protein [Haloarchaeobius amylolyticus]